MGVRTGYKQTEVGAIPAHWGVGLLRDLVDPSRTIRYGIVQPGKRDTNGRYMIRGQDYSNGWVDPSELFRVSPAVEEPFENARVQTGDVLITIVGASTGRVAIVPPWLNGANLTQTTARIAPRTDRVDRTYCSYVLASPIGSRQVANYLKGAAQPGLNCGDIEKFLIPLPPLPEQRAIAAALSDVDALLGGMERLIAKKRDLKQAAMQQLLTGQTRLPGFHGEWEVKQVGSLVTTGPKNGYSGRSAKGASGTPTLSLGATTSGALALNDDTVKRLEETIDATSDLFLQAGDVLVQRSNTLDLVGTTAVFNGPSGMYVYPDLMMRMRFREEATAHWFWRYANSADGRRFFMSVAAGSSGSMPKIGGDKLRQMRVPFPTLQEQTAIAAVLSDMDAELAALEQRRDKTRALKEGMMQELLTGRTRLVAPSGAEMPA